MRFRAFWPGDEVVAYIGLAGTSLRKRVGRYYRTPLGARRPHAGGWWLKTLTVLDDLWVHYAATHDGGVAEVAMFPRRGVMGQRIVSAGRWNGVTRDSIRTRCRASRAAGRMAYRLCRGTRASSEVS